MQIFEIKRYDTNEVIFSAECETLRECVEIAIKQEINLKRANLKWANLEGANFYGANLKWANFYGANLEGANLEGANFKWANLEGANLEGANLKGASLGPAGVIQNFTTISKIGSRDATLQIFKTEKGLFFSTGCQNLITEETFIQRVKDTHSGTKYERQYMASIEFVKTLFSE